MRIESFDVASLPAVSEFMSQKLACITLYGTKGINGVTEEARRATGVSPLAAFFKGAYHECTEKVFQSKLF